MSSALTGAAGPEPSRPTRGRSAAPRCGERRLPGSARPAALTRLPPGPAPRDVPLKRRRGPAAPHLLDGRKFFPALQAQAPQVSLHVFQQFLHGFGAAGAGHGGAEPGAVPTGQGQRLRLRGPGRHVRARPEPVSRGPFPPSPLPALPGSPPPPPPLPQCRAPRVSRTAGGGRSGRGEPPEPRGLLLLRRGLSRACSGEQCGQEVLKGRGFGLLSGF